MTHPSVQIKFVKFVNLQTLGRIFFFFETLTDDPIVRTSASVVNIHSGARGCTRDMVYSRYFRMIYIVCVMFIGRRRRRCICVLFSSTSFRESLKQTTHYYRNTRIIIAMTTRKTIGRRYVDVIQIL